MNFAQALGLFLSFYADRELAADGREPLPFPGPPAAYYARHTEVGQSTLARAHIFASSLEGAANGEVYNIGDCETTQGASWAEKWASICGYFGLVGTGPEGGKQISLAGYITGHQGEWGDFERRHNLRTGIIAGSNWEFLEVLLTVATFDRQYDLSKFSAAGFGEKTDVLQNYVETFDLMKKARMIPN